MRERVIMPGVMEKIKDYIGFGEEAEQMKPVQSFGATEFGGQHPEDGQRITTIVPRSFNDSRKIGEAFREGLTTVINLATLPEADSRRVIDFAAGLVFGLNGNIERVDTKVFILTPVEVTVVSESVEFGSSNNEFYNHG
ncbi:MAG: cell division protein SepF [Candidatus Ancillula sp.]|nr:cell division protein SepF [Candidatus Ancillula sp.]